MENGLQGPACYLRLVGGRFGIWMLKRNVRIASAAPSGVMEPRLSREVPVEEPRGGEDGAERHAPALGERVRRRDAAQPGTAPTDGLSELS